MKINIIVVVILIIGGGFVFKYLGERRAIQKEKQFKEIILQRVAESCKHENTEIGKLKFHAPYDWGRVYVNGLTDSVTFFLDRKLSDQATISKVIVPGCLKE